jgi:AAA ATPase domain
MGKSRLAMEMAEYASRIGFKCLVGHCYERDEPCPYLPFVEIIESGLAQAAGLDDFRRRLGDNAGELAQRAPSFRRVFPDIPQPLELPPSQKRRYLFQNVFEALGRLARTRSYLYILEDLHWADESTLALLIDLAHRVAQLPVVIIGTYREGYAETNPGPAEIHRQHRGAHPEVGTRPDTCRSKPRKGDRAAIVQVRPEPDARQDPRGRRGSRSCNQCRRSCGGKPGRAPRCFRSAPGRARRGSWEIEHTKGTQKGNLPLASPTSPPPFRTERGLVHDQPGRAGPGDGSVVVCSSCNSCLPHRELVC